MQKLIDAVAEAYSPENIELLVGVTTKMLGFWWPVLLFVTLYLLWESVDKG